MAIIDPNPDNPEINSDTPVDATDVDIPGLVGFIKARFVDSETGRLDDERRWLKAYKNYRGIYDASTKFRESERSRVFVKVTKTKVIAAYGQIIDILFSQNRFPLTVSATAIPEGIAEYAHLDSTPDQPEEPVDNPYGFVGDGLDLEPGALSVDQTNFLGGLENKYEGANMKAGPGRMGEPTISPAKESALQMEKRIHDQLTETSAMSVVRHSVFECVLLGTGIVKGPFNIRKKIHQWKTGEEGREYAPYYRVAPKVEAVSCWDFYPDPSAVSMDDAEYVIQRHKMNLSQLRDLRTRPFFKPEAISMCIGQGSNYVERGYESELYAENQINNTQGRFEVLEYWGNLDAKMAEEVGLDVPEGTDPGEHVQINAWICGNEVIRVVLNPFTPERLPYQAFPYELNPYQFFGVGVPENMDDAQVIMNGHMRMAIDNLALAGNLVFDIDESQLVAGQSLDIFPGKKFRRQSGQPGQAVHGIKFPNTAPENIQMYDKARQLADEETGIQSISHGQTGVSGTGRTAAGLSMILGSASLSTKTVVKNIDDFLIKPMGEAFFHWNMQFNEEDIELHGDLEIKARGTSSVMQKEVRSQRLNTLLQTVSNPMLAPFAKLHNIMREIAISQDIEPETFVNNPEEAAIFAEILRGMQPNPEAPLGGGGAPGANPNDASGVGGGNIGVGGAPGPNEPGFTGNGPKAP